MQNIKFRRTLQQEANHWRSEGLIDSAFHTKLADHYQFDNLDAEASGTFISAIISLGGGYWGAEVTVAADRWLAPAWAQRLYEEDIICRTC
jgi:uncharacterized membrane protein